MPRPLPKITRDGKAGGKTVLDTPQNAVTPPPCPPRTARPGGLGVKAQIPALPWCDPVRPSGRHGHSLIPPVSPPSAVTCPRVKSPGVAGG